MLEGIICPVCEATLEEIDIKESLTCKTCKTDLKDRKYLDFLEFLMANGLVEDLDFFDQKVYSEDVERLEPDDEEDVDPAEFEKKKDIFSLYETEMEMYKQKTSFFFSNSAGSTSSSSSGSRRSTSSLYTF
jgi:hypothetical protein